MNTENNTNSEATPQDVIDKHLDIAIEAQDGPQDTTNTASSTESNETQNTETGKQQQPENREGSTSNDKPQPQSGQEGQRPSHHGSRDLTLKDGTVVRGGAERRFYEQREAARQQLGVVEQRFSSLQRDHDELQRRYEAMEASVKALHGMDPQNVQVGATIVTDLQRDPVGTVNKLLAEIKAKGYNVEGIGAGVDMAAIQRMIDERLPKQNTETNDPNKIAADAQAEAATFFQQFPDAQPHDRLIAAVLRDHPNLSLQDAYFQLKNAFIEKGYDWGLTLEANLQANGQSSTEQNGTGGNLNSNGNRAPLPNGGGNANAGDDLVPTRTTLAHESEDTADIVRAAMRESGLNI